MSGIAAQSAPARRYTPIYPALSLPWLLVALAFAFPVCAALVAGGAWHHGPTWFEDAGLAAFVLAWLVP